MRGPFCPGWGGRGWLPCVGHGHGCAETASKQPQAKFQIQTWKRMRFQHQQHLSTKEKRMRSQRRPTTLPFCAHEPKQQVATVDSRNSFNSFQPTYKKTTQTRKQTPKQFSLHLTYIVSSRKRCKQKWSADSPPIPKPLKPKTFNAKRRKRVAYI